MRTFVGDPSIAEIQVEFSRGNVRSTQAKAEEVSHRRRVHRELGLLEFKQALADLEHATQLASQMLDAQYHLGLTHYVIGEFDQAAASFIRARDLARSDDSLIDCTNWLYVSLMRGGRAQ